MMVSRDIQAPKLSNAIYMKDLTSNLTKVHREKLNKNSKMLYLEVHEGFKEVIIADKINIICS